MRSRPRDPLRASAWSDHRRLEEVERLVTALQDPTRRRILLSLVGHGEPRTVDDLAQLVGIHRTVAFTHLERLAGLGYLEKSQRRGRMGKPASLYSARPGILSMTYPARQFVALAGILAAGVDGLGDDGPAVGKAAGRRFGEDAARAGARSVAEALTPLDALGADYAVEGDQIFARNCIFLEACGDARQVVCGVQAGILEGALHGAGMQATVAPLGPLPTHGCAYRFTRRRRAA